MCMWIAFKHAVVIKLITYDELSNPFSKCYQTREFGANMVFDICFMAVDAHTSLQY